MIRIELLTESSLIICFGEGIDPSLSLCIRQAVDAIDARFGALLTDMVPSYNSLHITFCLGRVCGPDLRTELLQLLQRLESEPVGGQVQIEHDIPVYYGTEVALDLEQVALCSGLSRKQVIALHCATPYRVYAIGFSPGFCYLGTIPEQLATPRKDTPRSRVRAGSVAIAERQTAIYPDDSPGGWQVLGRTPQPMHPADSKAPRLQVGDLVRFCAIDRREFLALGGKLD
ncbi:MAG: allophanate hydrolase subunit 1 [Gammaproteobacteria bacterium]|nr:allophanate hydrolase subunit 1 [Gammaproteobacteria bacterium]MCP5444487.1 allophanate hydrolase subunit 1 [Chromatiaceae bacterium]